MNKKEIIEEMASDMNFACIELSKEQRLEIARVLINLDYLKIPEDSVVLSKEEHEGKEIAVEMSGGHKLRLTVGKFGEMSRVLEDFTRKEMVKEILSMIDKIPTNEVNELNHLRLLKINIAKQVAIEVE